MEKLTKDKIKAVAFSIFSLNGYEATTMNEIAQGVGIKKPSLYAHFTSKEELFLNIFRELAQDYQDHMNQVVIEAKELSEDKALYHLFVQYIAYFIENPDKLSFWNRVLYFTPALLNSSIHVTIYKVEMAFQEEMAMIFNAGMQNGLIKNGNVDDRIMSFRALRSGVLAFLHLDTGLKPEKIEAIWNDYWFGIKE